ncbi:MAG: response regulator transcription factor [Cyclobacteriaceae bacterium]|jgi:two-component system response regulator DegU
MAKIDVCIVDDHQIFRKAMQRLLKTFKRVNEVLEAENGQACLQLLKQHQPQVLLLDLEMPVMNGVDCAEAVLKKYPDIKIIILTMHDSEKYMLYLMEMGVHSFLLKNTGPEELEMAITQVVDNDFYHNELLNSVLRKGIHQNGIKVEKPAFVKLADLTEREQEVLRMICREMSVKDMALQLGVATSSVQTYKTRIMAKLGIKNTIGLLRFALETGLIL